ncbi:MAG: hypothetical protein R2734_10095 [Nocardioides sp.]
MRAAAALLAARARPSSGRRQRRTPGCCSPRSRPSSPSGPLLRRRRRQAGRGGGRLDPGGLEREADDLVRDADRFLGVVEVELGLTPHVPFDGRGRAAVLGGRAGVA